MTNVALALLVAFALISALLIGAGGSQGFYALCILVPIAAQIAVRLATMNVGTHDARMTFPVIVPFIALYGILIEHQLRERMRMVAVPGCVLLGAFIGLGLFGMLSVIG